MAVTDEFTAAREVLTYLGYSQDVSMEPSADYRRDRIATIIRRHLSLPVINTDIDRTSEPKGHWEDGGKVWVEDHDCSLPGEWQPIETYVIVNSGPYTPHVFCAHKDKKWMRMGRYDVALKRWYYSGTNERSQWAQVEGDEPTHWQPLPEAPK